MFYYTLYFAKDRKILFWYFGVFVVIHSYYFARLRFPCRFLFCALFVGLAQTAINQAKAAPVDSGAGGEAVGVWYGANAQIFLKNFFEKKNLFGLFVSKIPFLAIFSPSDAFLLALWVVVPSRS